MRKSARAHGLCALKLMRKSARAHGLCALKLMRKSARAHGLCALKLMRKSARAHGLCVYYSFWANGYHVEISVSLLLISRYSESREVDLHTDVNIEIANWVFLYVKTEIREIKN